MPQVKLEDTIAALSTPPGEGGIAVIRVSGPEAVRLADHFFRPSNGDCRGAINRAPTHTIHHGHWKDERGQKIDEVLVSVFRAPRSYTGEEVVEISCHGGMLVTRRILELLVERGARHAEPGEFTKRAFLNRKIDLTQAEAVLDLIRAKSEASLETALHQLEGGLSKKMTWLKERLLRIQAQLEASLDFPDERLEVDSYEACLKETQSVTNEIENLVQSFSRGALLREGILTVIVGKPNVGKSSLFNALLVKDRALVSPIAGTTRDALEETLQVGGYPVRLADTAGVSLRPQDPLDAMGAERTRRYLKEGQIFLFLLDGSTEWTREDEILLEALKGKQVIPVINKTDLCPVFAGAGFPRPQGAATAPLQTFLKEKPCLISCLTGSGFSELERRLQEKISMPEKTPESLTLTRLRHKQALEQSLGGLRSVSRAFQEDASAELVLVDLKFAIDSLRELIGEIYSEDLLDVIFREFCIGK